METRPFLRSAPGHILQGTAGILIVLSGVIATVGPGPNFNTLVPLAIVIGYIGFISAVGLAVGDYWAETLAMILIMPMAFGIYFAGMYLVVSGGAGLGAGLIIAGLLMTGASAFTGSLASRPGRHAQASH